MHVKLPKRVIEKMSDAEVSRFLDRERWSMKGLDAIGVSLVPMAIAEIEALKEMLVGFRDSGTRNLQMLIRDIDTWLNVIDEGTAGQARGRTLRQFSDLLVEYIRTSPGQRVYEKVEDSDEWLAYYANDVDYESEYRGRDTYRPAMVKLNLLYYLLGTQYSTTFRWTAEDADRKTVIEAMGDKRLMIETPERRSYYLETRKRHEEVFPQIGVQYTTTGHGKAIDERERHLGVWSGSRKIPMMSDGVPAKVVIDVVSESGEKQESRAVGRLERNFWNQKRPSATKRDDSEVLPGNEEILEGKSEGELSPMPEVPVHPFVPVYHLSKHTRYQVNVMELEPYVFDKTLGENLVLPEITKELVDTLISQGRISFQDIVAGKGSGACVLLGGPPGVGKTLTAEVFAEATERPLLSVQAAQLGIEPNNIETNLLGVLRRGSRWNAVVLLDEADVYIAERGTDLHQNAIVAAFLRILEHHTATIFLTTNRSDSVDDAVASRCLARIDYGMPSQDEQRRIWEVLNRLNNVGLDDSAISQILDAHDSLSGRDIKQLLKLAALWAESHGEQVTPAAVDFVKGFLPTRPVKR